MFQKPVPIYLAASRYCFRGVAFTSKTTGKYSWAYIVVKFKQKIYNGFWG